MKKLIMLFIIINIIFSLIGNDEMFLLIWKQIIFCVGIIVGSALGLTLKDLK